MNTVVDLDAAFVEALAAADEWEAEFQKEFTAPARLVAATLQFLAAPEVERQALKHSDPELYQQVKANVDQLARRMRGKHA